ncbi:conserved hypothetical protein [Burkholderia cenocepacia]|uniref:hypothetical protein n=1 Tax=Burkholderia cenocepacia TaxID=95486 RepID=UPI00192BFE6E|nr:hypothetical protein [Burkholderia cenocepacia]CAD9228366.1 conserved hypothetical protein [Burkholderia cenocepacia]
MQTESILLKANQRYPIVGAGSVLLIQDADQGANLSIRFFNGTAVAAEVDSVGAGFRAKPDNGFSGIDLLAPVDTNVTLTFGTGDIQMQLAQLGVVVTNTPDKPVPVSIVGEPGQPFEVTNVPGQDLKVSVDGTVNVSGATLTATNVGINNTDANPVPVRPIQATSVTDAAPVPVPAFTGGSPNQVHIRAAGACRALRVANPLASTGKLFVGGAGVTPTNAVIVLLPGDIWNETDAPQIDWYATSDTGASANLQVIA